MLISSPKALLSPGFDSVGIVFVVRFFVSNCIVIYAILGQSKQNFKKKKKRRRVLCTALLAGMSSRW